MFHELCILHLMQVRILIPTKHAYKHKEAADLSSFLFKTTSYLSSLADLKPKCFWYGRYLIKIHVFALALTPVEASECSRSSAKTDSQTT